jgi:hypothetical protein
MRATTLFLLVAVVALVLISLAPESDAKIPRRKLHKLKKLARLALKLKGKKKIILLPLPLPKFHHVPLHEPIHHAPIHEPIAEPWPVHEPVAHWASAEPLAEPLAHGYSHHAPAHHGAVLGHHAPAHHGAHHGASLGHGFGGHADLW